ncbi:conserved hypothetical protein, partial [Ricinus communis]
ERRQCRRQRCIAIRIEQRKIAAHQRLRPVRLRGREPVREQRQRHIGHGRDPVHQRRHRCQAMRRARRIHVRQRDGIDEAPAYPAPERAARGQRHPRRYAPRPHHQRIVHGHQVRRREVGRGDPDARMRHAAQVRLRQRERMHEQHAAFILRQRRDEGNDARHRWPCCPPDDAEAARGMPQVRVAQHGFVGGQAREREPGRPHPRPMLLGREKAHAVAARTQCERQREEREQVAGRADRDNDEVSGFDGNLLLEYGTASRRILPMRL